MAGRGSTFVRRLLATSLVRNALLMMSTTGANLALGFVFVVAATRIYTTAEFGLGSAIVAAMSLCSTVGGAGVGNLLIQTLPGRPSGEAWARTVCAGLAVAAALGVAIGVVVLVVLPLLADDFAPLRATPLAAIAFLVGVVALLSGDMADRTFVAERRTGGMLARNIAASTLKLALLALPPVRHGGAWGFAAAWIAAPLLAAPYAVVLLRRLDRGLRPVARGLRAEARSLRGALTGNHLVSIGNLAPQFLLPILVTAIVSPAANGVFTATWRVGGTFMIVSVAVSTTLFAEISNEGGGMRRAVRRAGLVIAAILLPAILVMLVVGRPILRILGPDYVAGYSLLVLFLIGSIPDAVTNVSVAVLRHLRRYRFAAVLTTGMAAITLGFTAILLPEVGLDGAGWGWLLAQTCGCMLVAGDMLRRRRAAAGAAG